MVEVEMIDFPGVPSDWRLSQKNLQGLPKLRQTDTVGDVFGPRCRIISSPYPHLLKFGCLRFSQLAKNLSPRLAPIVNCLYFNTFSYSMTQTHLFFKFSEFIPAMVLFSKWQKYKIHPYTTPLLFFFFCPRLLTCHRVSVFINEISLTSTDEQLIQCLLCVQDSQRCLQERE